MFVIIFTGELIGFVDLGDIDLNYSTLNDVSQLASYILVFMIKSLANPLSYSLATFATAGITSGQLYPLFWRAVAYLEMTCALKVVASTADGASPNRKFFRIHKVNICLIFIPNYYLMLLYLQIISQGFFILRKTGHAC